MLSPAFHIHLHEKVQRAQAAIGNYDGKHPSLTCATAAGKVFLHSPHQPSDASSNGITYLNINKQITALAAGCLQQQASGSSRDVLLIGTPSILQCYDVDQNKDLFFKDLPDGANTIVVGRYGSNDQPTALVGGNCSVQGFDHAGADRMWMVTGDNVSAMALCDIDGDGHRELVVGSDDFDLRVFQNNDMLAEVSEADQFVALSPIQHSHFGYALVNGTIGVYDRLDRVWRVKSKHTACAVAAYDMDGDGVPELVTGWDNGRVEVRREDTGEVVFRDHLTCAVSAVLAADYRGDGAQQLVVCGSEGEVRGYLPPAHHSSTAEADVAAAQAALAELGQRKQELMYELASYQNAKSGAAQADLSSNLIPSNTQISSTVAVNAAKACCDLILTTNNNQAVIRGAVLFGEQLFDGESLFVYPKAAESKLAVPLRPIKDVPVALLVKAMVGTRTSTVYHIFELEAALPKFAMYAPADAAKHTEPASATTFLVNERIAKIAAYLEAQFNHKAKAAGSEAIEAWLVCLRDQQPLVIKAQAMGSTQVQVVIHTDNMDTAGEVVSDLVAYLNVQDLASTAQFPQALQAFSGVLARVQEHNHTRIQLNAEMADTSQLAKTLLVKAEDLRLLGDMQAMRRMYKRLHGLNRDLIADHTKRATNHTALLADLKEVNLMIQRAARLRAGVHKTQIVAACRAAVKEDNMQQLLRIIRDGSGPT